MKRDVEKSKDVAKRDGVEVPTTLSEYVIQAPPVQREDSIGSSWSDGDSDEFNFDDTDDEDAADDGED